MSLLKEIKMPKFYIASKLENADKVRELKTILEEKGWEHTYDWTKHGSVQQEGLERIREVAKNEAEGVYMADVVIVLLPGGRGTHVELGIALGVSDCYVLTGDDPAPAIVVLGTEADFNSDGGTCAFYHHPNVERCTTGDMLMSYLNDLTEVFA